MRRLQSVLGIGIGIAVPSVEVAASPLPFDGAQPTGGSTRSRSSCGGRPGSAPCCRPGPTRPVRSGRVDRAWRTGRAGRTLTAAVAGVDVDGRCAAGGCAAPTGLRSAIRVFAAATAGRLGLGHADRRRDHGGRGEGDPGDGVDAFHGQCLRWKPAVCEVHRTACQTDVQQAAFPQAQAGPLPAGRGGVRSLDGRVCGPSLAPCPQRPALAAPADRKRSAKPAGIAGKRPCLRRAPCSASRPRQ